MTRRIVVTGKTGQVVSSFLERASDSEFEVITLGRPELDLSGDTDIAAAVRDLDPALVVNAAAYTAVDKAESEPKAAHALNAVAAGEVAAGAKRAGAPIIHLSTDYVFDGQMRRSYNEGDAVSPLGVYGRTKREGEERVADANPNHFIVRTAWVYSPFGSNFVKTMLRLARCRDNLDVVDDQLGNPTSAHDIADGLIAAARHILGEASTAAPGTYHLAGTGTASWCEVARAIFAISARTEGAPSVRPVTTEDYPTPAARPRNSRLDCTRFGSTFGYTAPVWHESLARCVRRLEAGCDDDLDRAIASNASGV